MHALQTGSLLDSDRKQFEVGLVKLGWLAYPPYQSTVAQEIISNGLLKELDQTDLRSAVARIPTRVESAERGFGVRREHMTEPRKELWKLVNYRYEGTFDLTAMEGQQGGAQAFEDAIDVSFDFDSLANNLFLKNLVIDATKSQVENFGIHQRMCNFLNELDTKLTGYGYP